MATKALHVDASLAPLAGLAPEAVIVTVQNGIGSEQVVQRHGAWPIVSGVTFMSGTRHADTHVEYELDTPTWLGPFAGTATPQALVDEVAALIVAAGLKAEALPDLLPAQWSKLIFNSAVNAVAATTGLPHVRRYAQVEELDDLGHVVRGMMDEGKAVAAAAGVELHDDPWEMNVRAVSRGSTAASSTPTRRACSRTCARTARPRSTSSPAPWCARPSASTCPRRSTRRCTASCAGSRRPGAQAGVRIVTRVLIVGCGAIGSLFAAAAAQADGVEVWAYDAWPEHVDAINRDGLRLTGAGEAHVRVHATTDASAIPPCELGDRGDEGDAHLRAPWPPARARSPTPPSAPCRTASATRRTSPRTSRA